MGGGLGKLSGRRWWSQELTGLWIIEAALGWRQVCEGLLGEGHGFCPGQLTGSLLRRELPGLLSALGGLSADCGGPGLAGCVCVCVAAR